MNGLLPPDQQPMPDPNAAPQPGAAPEPAPDPAAPPAPGGEGDAAGGGDEGNVTPEEQEQYNQFVGQALKLIYDPAMRDNILKRLGATQQPMDDLANTAVMVVKRVQSAAQKAGTTIDEAVLFHGGKEILEDLGEYATKMKVHDFTDKELEGSWYRALDLYRSMGEADGTLDPTQLKGEFQQINAADQQGKLNTLLPGIDKVKPPTAADEPPADDQVAAPGAPAAAPGGRR